MMRYHTVFVAGLLLSHVYGGAEARAAEQAAAEHGRWATCGQRLPEPVCAGTGVLALAAAAACVQLRAMYPGAAELRRLVRELERDLRLLKIDRGAAEWFSREVAREAQDSRKRAARELQRIYRVMRATVRLENRLGGRSAIEQLYAIHRKSGTALRSALLVLYRESR